MDGAMRQGSWSIPAIDGAEVRLRSGRIGLVTVDATAPISAGRLTVGTEAAALELSIALGRMRTGNLILQTAARSLISAHRVQDLVYSGTGPVAAMTVQGTATAGDIALEIALRITAIGPSHDPMGEIELTGSANVGTVHIPLPGMGTVEDFSFDVDARLRTAGA